MIDSRYQLSESARTKIDAWMKRYPINQKRSAVMEALRIVQEENSGFLSEDSIKAVAEYLEMQPIAVYEVATFYSMYNLQPVGKHVLELCTNISCMLNNAEEILAHLKSRLQIDEGETTLDGKFTLREVECLAACANAPCMQIGKQYYEDLTREKVDAILKELEHKNGE